MDRRNRRLRRAQEAAADLDRIGAERKGRRDSAPVADSTGRHDWQAHGVAHLRQKRNQAGLGVTVIGKERAAMSAGLAALGDGRIGSMALEPARLGDGRG